MQQKINNKLIQRIWKSGQLNSAKLRPSVVPCKANLHMQRNSDGHQTRSNTSTSCKWPSCADTRTNTHTRTIVRFNCTSNKKSVDDNGVKYNHEGHVKGHHKAYRFYFFWEGTHTLTLTHTNTHRHTHKHIHNFHIHNFGRKLGSL